MRDIKKPLTLGWGCLYGIGPTSVRSIHEPLHQRNSGAAPRRDPLRAVAVDCQRSMQAPASKRLKGAGAERVAVPPAFSLHSSRAQSRSEHGRSHKSGHAPNDHSDEWKPGFDAWLAATGSLLAKEGDLTNKHPVCQE